MSKGGLGWNGRMFGGRGENRFRGQMMGMKREKSEDSGRGGNSSEKKIERKTKKMPKTKTKQRQRRNSFIDDKKNIFII